MSVALTPIQNLHGYDSPWAPGAGKNKGELSADSLFSQQRATQQYENNGVVITATGNYARSGFEFDVVQGQTYTVSYKALGNGSLNTIYDSMSSSWGPVHTTVLTGVETTYTYTFTADSNKYYFGVYVTDDTTTDGSITIKDFQLEVSPSATTFAPYSNICPITGRASTSVSTTDGTDTETASITFGQTVYGGTVNFNTGVVTVDRAIVDMGDLTYNYNSENNVFSTSVVSDMAAPISDKVQIMCSVLKGLTPKDLTGIVNADDNTIAFNSTDAVKLFRLKCTAYTDGNAFKTAMTGQKIVYELATPVELTLTADELQMLKGDNSVTGDGVITITAYTGDPWPIEEG